jgi:hypothetical protein
MCLFKLDVFSFPLFCTEIPSSGLLFSLPTFPALLLILFQIWPRDRERTLGQAQFLTSSTVHAQAGTALTVNAAVVKKALEVVRATHN